MATRVVLFLLSLFIGCMSGCPCGFQAVNNACYRLSQHSWTWNSAWKECAKHGGYLAEFSEHWKLGGLREFLNSIDEDVSYWIGASDGVVPGDWRWMISGDQVSFTEKLWCLDRPIQNETYHAILLDRTRGYCMSNADPTETQMESKNIGFVCEAPVV